MEYVGCGGAGGFSVPAPLSHAEKMKAETIITNKNLNRAMGPSSMILFGLSPFLLRGFFHRRDA